MESVYLMSAPRNIETSKIKDNILTIKPRRTRSLTRHKVRLTSEEFASLQQLANKPTQVTIPVDHRDRLIEAGYVREVLPRLDGTFTLVLTGTGLRRAEFGE
jgi:hypothetical protein